MLLRWLFVSWSYIYIDKYIYIKCHWKVIFWKYIVQTIDFSIYLIWLSNTTLYFWWLKLLKKMMSLLCMTIERAKATLDCDSMLCFFAFFLQMAYDDFLIIFWPRTNFYYCNLFPIHLMRYAVGLFWFSFRCCTIVDKKRNFKALTYILHTNHGDALNIF